MRIRQNLIKKNKAPQPWGVLLFFKFYYRGSFTWKVDHDHHVGGNNNRTIFYYWRH